MTNDKDLEHLMDADPKDYQGDEPEEDIKEYLYEARILDADTNEVLVKVSSYSPESLEEEMGKSKWTKAIENYEAKLQKEKEEAEAEERFNEICDGTLPEDIVDKEKEADLINDVKAMTDREME